LKQTSYKEREKPFLCHDLRPLCSYCSLSFHGCRISSF